MSVRDILVTVIISVAGGYLGSWLYSKWHG